MTLAEFLEARLGDDEAIAMRTLDINVKADMKRGKATAPRWLPQPGTSGICDEKGIKRVHHTWVDEREHITRHDPARVLADIDSARQIINEHAAEDGHCRTCTTEDREVLWDGENEVVQWVRAPAPSPCMTLRLLGLPWVGHPQYDEAWRP